MQIDPTVPITMSGISGSAPGPKPVETFKTPAQLSPESDGISTGSDAVPKETAQAIQELNQAIEPFNVSLKFTKDPETGTMVVQMIDQKSGDTVQQIPSAASLQIAATLCKLQGKIFSRKA